MHRRLLTTIAFAMAFGCAIVPHARGAEIFLTPSGGDDWAALNSVLTTVNPGDTVFLHGGTYNFTQRLQTSRAGTSANPINLFAVAGETPIFDFSGQSLGSSSHGVRWTHSATWWHVKGLTVQNAGDNGINMEGHNNIFEQVVTRFNRDSGFQLETVASNNLILNSDSYRNYDPQNRGENADGFAVKDIGIGSGNVFLGARAWENSDDGWDMFAARANGMLIMNSWAFDNGYDPGGAGTFNGDGNGFKLGHDSGSHILAGNLAVSNPSHGIDINGNGYTYSGNTPLFPNGNLSQLYNNTSFDNGNRNFFFDEDLPHTLRNNVSFSGSGADVFAAQVVHDHNTWNGGIFAVNGADFVSFDLGDGIPQQTAVILQGARQADGSLPDLGGFLQLVPDSNLIDAGTPISFTFGGVTYNLPYNGSGPDLGAFEFLPAASGLLGDYNNNEVVDAADYTMWRDAMTAAGLLVNDPTPDSVDESDFIYWRDHFGESLGGGAGAGSATGVPEPTSFMLACGALGALLYFRVSKRAAA